MGWSEISIIVGVVIVVMYVVVRVYLSFKVTRQKFREKGVGK